MSDATGHVPQTGQRGRHPWRAGLVSLACFIGGLVAFTANFGLIHDLHGQAGIDRLNGILLFDLLIGVPAAIAAGPVRRTTIGNALLLLAGVFSSFALPAAALALVRFGERRSRALDTGLVLFVAVTSAGVSAWHGTLLGERSVPWLEGVIAAGIAFALVLWGRARGTRAALITSLREQAEKAEKAQAELADEVRKSNSPPENSPPATVTAREWEVGRFVARGLTNSEIAAALYVSEATVKTHLKSLFAKLHVRNRVQLAVRVLEHDGR